MKRVLAAASVAALALAVWFGQSGADALGRAWQQAALVVDRAAQMTVWQWVVALAGIAFAHALRAQRIHAEWHPRLGVSWIECLHVVTQHYAALNLLPMRAGEAGFAWLLWRRWGVHVESAAIALVTWRLQDGVILLVFAALFLWPASLEARLAATSLIAIGALCVGGGRLELARLVATLGSSCRHLGARHSLQRLSAALSQPGAGATPWVCGLGTWATKLLVAGVMLSGLGPMDAGTALAGAVAGELGAALPLQPFAGFGVYEAAVWAGVSLRSPAAGAVDVLTAALLVHLLFVSTSLAFGAVSWWVSRRVPAQDPSAAETSQVAGPVQ